MSADTAFEVGRLYQPIKVIADTLMSSQDKIFLELPGIIAWFPGGPVGRAGGEMLNKGGTELDLLRTGVCTLGYDGHPYRQTGLGVNFMHNSGFGLIGTEAWIDAPLRGYTIGGWFYTVAYSATASGLVSKDGAAVNRGYNLHINTPADDVEAFVSGDGVTGVTASIPFPGLGEWYFAAARFTPSTEIAVFANGAKAVNTASVPAVAFVSTQDFEVSRYRADNNRIHNGRVRDVFVCQAALSDELIADIRRTSAP